MNLIQTLTISGLVALFLYSCERKLDETALRAENEVLYAECSRLEHEIDGLMGVLEAEQSAAKESYDEAVAAILELQAQLLKYRQAEHIEI